MSHPRIVIIGGGFAGLYTALRLNQFPWEEHHRPVIKLIDQQDHFLFSPLLYELITEEMQPWEVAPTYSDLFRHSPVSIVQDHVQTVEVEAKQVICDGQSIPYDQLVIAAGGTTKFVDLPGVKDYALPFKSLKDALRLKEKLRQLEQSNAEKIRIAIVGGGYSGVELACKLADRLGDRGRLRIVDRGDQILDRAPKFNQLAAQAALEERQIWLDYNTEVTSVTSDSISLRYKDQIDEIPVELVLWTGGTRVAPWIGALALPHTDSGKLSITDKLQVQDHPDIFALGDVAQGEDSFPMTAQVAIQQADICAWNLRAMQNNSPLLPFNFYNLGEMLTLGENNATLSGLGIELEGDLAHIVRRLVYLYRLPTWEHQLQVGFHWLTQPLRDSLNA